MLAHRQRPQMGFHRKSGILPKSWATQLVFLATPSGGYRPISLIVSVLRVWGRIRLADTKRWALEHADPCFWGTEGLTRKRAVGSVPSASWSSERPVKENMTEIMVSRFDHCSKCSVLLKRCSVPCPVLWCSAVSCW